MGGSDSFDQIYFNEAVFEPPRIEGGVVQIAVRKLGLGPSHPENRGGRLEIVEHSILVFRDVTVSQRRVRRYIERAEEGFGPEEVLEDGAFPPTSARQNAYELEGVLTDPRSWVEWTIHAGSCEVER